jgi:hypothetical protein
VTSSVVVACIANKISFDVELLMALLLVAFVSSFRLVLFTKELVEQKGRIMGI